MPFDNPYFPTTFDVGTLNGGHIHFANDGSLTLYGPDGVTILASLTPALGLKLFQGNSVHFTSGVANESDGVISIGHVAAAGNNSPYIEIDTPYVGVGGGVAATMRLTASSPNGGVIPRQFAVSADQLDLGSLLHLDNSGGSQQLNFDGQTLSLSDNGGGANTLAIFNSGGNKAIYVHSGGNRLACLSQIGVGGDGADGGGNGGMIAMYNVTGAPVGSIGGGGLLYVQAGALKYRGAAGTVTNIANS